MLVVAALVAAPSLVGCGAAEGSRATVARSGAAEGATSSAGGETGGSALASSDGDRLESARRERRIRELESRLAMADAEVRDLRGRLDAHDADASARPVVRIGDARTIEREPADAEPREPEARVDDGPRPILRLYGASAPIAEGASAPSLVRPIPALASSPTLPSPPLARGLGPLPVVGAGGSRLEVPPIPESPIAVASAPPIAARPPPASSRRPEDDPVALEYRVALEDLAARRFDRALAALTSFLATHPSHPYASSAMYWRGEVLYMQRDYAGAERALSQMLERFPLGSKAADALLRLGFCRQRQGDPEGARAYFRRVRLEHPGTVAARLAMREDT